VNSVWVLTEEYNQYDQYGEYFRAVFANKPTAEQLKQYLHPNEYDWITHILDGGGRTEDNENNWYHLREIKC
jgi:hypothetical protein